MLVETVVLSYTFSHDLPSSYKACIELSFGLPEVVSRRQSIESSMRAYCKRLFLKMVWKNAAKVVMAVGEAFGKALTKAVKEEWKGYFQHLSDAD